MMLAVTTAPPIPHDLAGTASVTGLSIIRTAAGTVSTELALMDYAAGGDFHAELANTSLPRGYPVCRHHVVGWRWWWCRFPASPWSALLIIEHLLQQMVCDFDTGNLLHQMFVTFWPPLNISRTRLSEVVNCRVTSTLDRDAPLIFNCWHLDKNFSLKNKQVLFS
jgi:hypothetical protein